VRAARAIAAMMIVAGCVHARLAPVTARPGRSIAIYMPADGTSDGDARALGYVDDRRWIEVPAGGELALTDLPAAADLDSLVIEALGDDRADVAVVQCLRAPDLGGALADLGNARALVGRTVDARLADGGVARGTVRAVDGDGLWLDRDGRAVRVQARRVTSLRIAGARAGTPIRCRVRGAPGRHLIRVAYATSSLGWRAVHRVEVKLTGASDGSATVRTGFQIVAPGWTGDAELALWRGLPGAGEPPEPVWSGAASLGGDVTVWGEPHAIAAHLVTIYRGAVVTESDSPRDPYWRQQSTNEVRTWLVLDARLPAGAAVVALADGAAGAAAPSDSVTRGGTAAPRIANATAEVAGDTTRVPLWLDPGLRGLRVKAYQSGDEHSVHEHLGVSVSNLGDRPRAVWIEEQLRPSRHHAIVGARPPPEVVAGWLRWKLTVPAGGVAKVACDLSYDL